MNVRRRRTSTEVACLQISADAEMGRLVFCAKHGRSLRFFATTAIFVAVYALANQLTGLRGDVGRGVFEFERAIPFVPWTIVPYLSVLGFYAFSFLVGDRATLDRHATRILVDLALSLVCYALFPLRFQFERPVPAGLFGMLFEWLGACDLPYNRAPSLHISLLLILWLRLRPLTPPRWHGLLQGWFALIGVSVLTTWQHHLIDIPAGLAVGALSVLLTSQAARARLRRSAPAIRHRLIQARRFGVMQR